MLLSYLNFRGYQNTCSELLVICFRRRWILGRLGRYFEFADIFVLTRRRTLAQVIRQIRRVFPVQPDVLQKQMNNQ
mgnify:CR=1 FL=1